MATHRQESDVVYSRNLPSALGASGGGGTGGISSKDITATGGTSSFVISTTLSDGLFKEAMVKKKTVPIVQPQLTFVEHLMYNTPSYFAYSSPYVTKKDLDMPG